MTPLSLLELVRVTQGTDAAMALNNARDLAAHAEERGYSRVWVAEHHNMAGVPGLRAIAHPHVALFVVCAERHENDARALINETPGQFGKLAFVTNQHADGTDVRLDYVDRISAIETLEPNRLLRVGPAWRRILKSCGSRWNRRRMRSTLKPQGGFATASTS